MLEIKSYDDWTNSEDQLQADPVDSLKNYADYVRSGYYKAGMLNEENEREIISGVQERAIGDGLIAPDAPEEEQNNFLGSLVGPTQNNDTNARFVLDHLRTGSESGIDPNDAKVATLDKYLAMKQAAPEQVADLQPTVDEILADKSLVKRAKMSAVDRGEYSIAAIDEDDGSRSLYTGATAKPDSIKGEVDSLLASGAISTSDLYRIDQSVKPINGGLSNSSENFRFDMFRRTVGELAKNDKDLGDFIQSSASAKREAKLAEQNTTGEAILAGAKTALSYPFIKFGEAVVGAGNILMGKETQEPAYAPDTKVSDILAGNDEIRKKFSAEEIEKFSNDLTTTAAGAVYRADRPETGIATDSMGNTLIAPQLLANKQAFEAAVTVAPLNADQQKQARSERTVLLEQSAPELKRVILEEEPEAASAYAKAKASGLTDAQFVEQWVGESKNYDAFNTRLEQFGKSAWKTVAEIPLGLAALGGNEWATKQMVDMSRDQSRREEYARLFGDQFGLGFQMINTVPQVATDIALTIGTGGIFAGAKTLAKTGALSVKSLLRTSAKFALSNVDEAAAVAFKSAAVAGGEAGVGNAIKSVGASLATKFAEQSPVFTTSFIRSATSTYGSIYSQMPDTMSHEEKHKNSLGYAMAAGLSTGIITSGMGLLGRGGVEEIATKRVRAMFAGETEESVLASGGKPVPVDKMNYRQAKQVYENLKNEGQFVSDAVFQKAMRSAISGTYKNWMRTTLGGALHESIEEALDQGVQMKLEDAALDKETPLSEKVAQVFTAGIIGGVMGGVSAGATQFGKVNKSEAALVYEGKASGLENIAKKLRETNSNATADYVQRLMDDARAKANAATQADIKAQEGVAKGKATEVVADVKEKQVVPIDTFLQAFFGKPQVAAEQEVAQPETVTFLNDLIGEPASYGGFSGTLELADNQEEVRLKLDRPYKQKGGEPVTHINLGPRLQNADSVITKYPTLMRTGDDIYGIKAGTPYITVGSTKEKFAPKPLPEGQTIDDRFEVMRDDDGTVRSITIKDAVSLKNGTVSMPVSVTDPSMIRAFAKEYNIDIAPPAPELADGQLQFGFAEGEIKDAEAPTEEEVAKGTEGQLEFNLDQTPEQQATQAILNRFDTEISDIKEKLKDTNLNEVRRGRLQDRLKRIQKDKRSYSAETIQMGMLTPDQQALYNSPDVEWNTQLDQIRNSYELTQDIAPVVTKILRGSLKYNTAQTFESVDSDLLDTIQEMADEIVSFAADTDNQVSDKIRKETLTYYNGLSDRIKLVRQYVDERDINTIKNELEDLGYEVTQQLRKPEPKPYPVTNILHYLISKGKLKTVDIVAGLEAEGDTGSLTKQTLSDFKYIPETREIEFNDPDGNVIYFPLNNVDISSTEMQKKLAKNEANAKAFIKEERASAKAAANAPEPEVEPEIPLDERVTNFLTLVTNYTNKLSELKGRSKLLDKSRTDQARVEAEFKVIRSEANQAIKDTLTSLAAEIKERNDLQEGLRREMVDQITLSIFGKGGFVPVSGSKAQFGRIIEPSVGLKTKSVVYPADKFRVSTEEDFFNQLVQSGQVVNLPTVGATIASAANMFTTNNGLLTYPAFSEAIVERVENEGQEVANPNAYIKDKNNLLRERVHQLYPPTGSVEYIFEGPQGKQVDTRLAAQLESKRVELSNIKAKAKAKNFDASTQIATIEKEITELRKKVKDIPKYRIGKGVFDMIRSQKLTDQFYPVEKGYLNGEAVTYGVFTNDIEIIRAQIADSLRIVIPASFKGILNPAIHVASDGVTVDGYFEPARDNPVLIGQFLSKLDTRRNSSEDPEDKARRTKYDVRAELFVNNMVKPSDIKKFDLGTSGLIKLVYDGATRFLKANAYSPSPDAKLPLTTEGIEEASRDALIDFTSRINEWRLAKHVVAKVIASIDWKTRIRSSEGKELIARALNTSVSNNNVAFNDLPQELRRLLIKEDTNNLTDAVKNSNLAYYVREMFSGLDDKTIANNIVKLDIGFKGTDPTSVMKQYGMYLFQNATSIEGKFYTMPDPRKYLAETKIVEGKAKTTLGRDFSTIANKHAKRERAESTNLPSISIDALEETFGGDFEFSDLVAGGRPYWQILLDATQQRREMGLTLNDYTDNTYSERFGVALSPFSTVFHDRGQLLATELENTVRGNKELGKAFRAIAKMVNLDTPAELAKVSDDVLVSILAKKLSDDALFRTNGGYANVVMSLLSETQEGQMAAGLMILKGWLPPVMIATRDDKRVQVPLRSPSERQSKVPASPPTPRNASPVGFVIIEEAKRVSEAEAKNEYVTTIADVEAYEANKQKALARIAGTLTKLGEEKAIALQTIEEARARISNGFNLLNAMVRPEVGPASARGADIKVISGDERAFWTSALTTQVNTGLAEIESLSRKLSNYQKLVSAQEQSTANNPSRLDLEIKRYSIALKDPKLINDPEQRTLLRDKYNELNSLKHYITFNGQSIIDGITSSIKTKQDQFDRISNVKGNGASALYGVILDIESSFQQLTNNREYIDRLSDASKGLVESEIKRVEYLMSLPQWKQLAIATENHPAQLRFRTDLDPEQQSRVDKYNKDLKTKQDYDAFATQRKEELRNSLVENGISGLGSELLTPYVDPADVVAPEFFEGVNWGRRPEMYTNAEATGPVEVTTPRSPEEVAKNIRQFSESINSITKGINVNPNGVEVTELPTRVTEGGQTKVLSKVRPVSYESEIPSNAVDYPTRMTNEGRARVLPRVRSIDQIRFDFSLSTLDPALRDVARQENIRMMNELGLVSEDSNSILRALSVLSNRGTAQQQAIVSILNAAPDLIRSVNIGIVDMQASFAGLYDKSNNTILLNLSEHNGRGLADVLLHELIHAVTVRVINNPTTAQQRAAVQRLEQIRNFALANAIKNGIDTDPTMQLGLSSLEEFVTYALTAPEFTPLLNGLTKPQERTILRRMIDGILSIFGFEPKSRPQTANAINELLDFTKMSLAHSNTFNMDSRWSSTLPNVSSENAKASNITRIKAAEKIQQTLRNAAEGSDAIVYASSRLRLVSSIQPSIQQALGEAVRYNEQIGAKETGEVLRPHMTQKQSVLLDVLLERVSPDLRVSFLNNLDSAYYRNNKEGIPSGVYLTRSNAIELYLDNLQLSPMKALAQTYLHEMVHAATVESIRSNSSYRAEIKDLMTHVKNNLPRRTKAYGFTDELEFISEALSNSRFQTLLSSVPSRREGNLTVLDELVDFVKRVLGIKNRGTALEDALELALLTTGDIDGLRPLSPNESSTFDEITITQNSQSEGGKITQRRYAVRGTTPPHMSDPKYLDSVKAGKLDYARKVVDRLAEMYGLDPQLEPTVLYNKSGEVIPLAERFAEAYSNTRYVRGSEAQGQGTVDAFDKEYLAAVEAGDTATMQRMVDEAAKAAGFERVYHGTFAGYAPRSTEKTIKLTLENLNFPAFFTNSQGDPSYKTRGGMDTRRGTSVEAFARITDGYTVGPQDQYRHYEIQNRTDLKSAAAITYDEAGNVIPLSQRFDLNSKDIRYVRGSEAQGQGPIDVVSEIQRILPEGITLEFDNTMVGQMGARRSRPNSIIVNPDTVNDLVYKLSDANARSAVRTFVDEELAHLASYRTFTEDDFANIAKNMGESMRGLVADMLYSNSESDYTKRQAMIAADLESGALTESDIAAEWVRSEMTRMAVGRSREEHLAFLRTNPSLLAKFLEGVRAFITELKARFSKTPTASTAAKISMASREFRSLRNGGVLPAPEVSTEGELGDTTHFINAVEGNIAEGQEDRTSFNLPIASTNPSKVAEFWKKAQQKMYDMPLELRRLTNQRDGSLGSIEYTMQDFAKRYPKLRDEALSAGIAIEDIGTILGTTAPAVQGEARKELQRKVRQFKADNAEDPNITRLAEDYEAKLTQPIADQFYVEFRKNQKVMEDQLRAKGFGALVDYLVEFRQEVNKYKQIINFDESNDVYLTRTFNYFTTEGWSLAASKGGIVEIDGKTVDFNKLRAAAADHFRAEVLFDAKNEGQTLTEDQIASKTIAYLDKYLKKLDEQAADSKELGTLNTVKRDVNRLLRKKDFDEPLRALLGEVTDPFENAVRTIYSVGRLAANDRFLRNFAREAIKSGLASRERTDGMTLLFPPNQNAELGDLAGLYVRSDVAAAIKQELGPKNRDQDTRSMELINSIGKGLAWVSGAAVTTQTLGSVGFYPRNILGGMALSAAQGIINPLYAREAARLSIRANLLGAESQEQRDTIRRLTELQILRDETRGRMAMDMLNGFTAGVDEQLDDLLNELVEVQATGDISKIAKRFNLKKGTKVTVEFLASLNNVIDSAFKVNAYMYELDQLKKAYGTESLGSLEVKAARKVKLTFPTHSDQLSFAKSFNKSPFAMIVLPFVRWKSEVLRTMFNTIPLAMEEINSGNDVMRARGIKRLVGFSSTVAGGGTAFGLIFGSLFGLLTGGKDKEDKDQKLGRVLTNEELSALREGLPDWQKNHGVFARLIGKDGVQVIDMSNILPHSQLTDIVKLGAQGNVKAIGEYIAKDLIGTQIAANALFEVAKNQDGFGNPIALQSDNAAQAYAKLFLHAAKSAFFPSAAKKIMEATRYGQQDAMLLVAGELTGARPTVMKKSDIEYRAMSKIRTAMDEDLALLNPIYSAKGFDVGNVGDQVGKYQSATNVTQGRLYDFMQNMKSMGSTEEGLIATGKRARISNQRLGYAIAGENYSWVPNEAAFKKIIENKTRGGEQDPMPLVDELIKVTVPNKPINYNVAQPFIK
jgi:hypothetical protein